MIQSPGNYFVFDYQITVTSSMIPAMSDRQYCSLLIVSVKTRVTAKIPVKRVVAEELAPISKSRRLRHRTHPCTIACSHSVRSLKSHRDPLCFGLAPNQSDSRISAPAFVNASQSVPPRVRGNKRRAPGRVLFLELESRGPFPKSTSLHRECMAISRSRAPTWGEYLMGSR